MNAVHQNLSKWHLSFSVCLNVFVPIHSRCLYYMTLRKYSPECLLNWQSPYFLHQKPSAGSALLCDANDTLLPSSHNLSHEKHTNQLKVNIRTTSDGKFNCCLLKSYWLYVSNVTFSNNWVMKYITSGDWNLSRRQMLFHKLKTKLFDYIQSHSLNTLNEEKLVSKVPMTYISSELPDWGSLLCKSHLQAHRVPHQRDNKYVKLNLWNWLNVRYMLAFFFRTVQYIIWAPHALLVSWSGQNLTRYLKHFKN